MLAALPPVQAALGDDGGGADLIPMSKADALAWAESHLDLEEVEVHFSDMLEDA